MVRWIINNFLHKFSASCGLKKRKGRSSLELESTYLLFAETIHIMQIWRGIIDAERYNTTLVAVSLYTKIDLKSHSQDVIEVQVLNFNSRGSIKV